MTARKTPSNGDAVAAATEALAPPDDLDASTPVVVRVARILDELPAIGKNRENDSQHYAFQGIEDILPPLNSLLGKYGVVLVPDVVERIYQERPTRSGGVMHALYLHVRYTFYGPAGDSFAGSSWGEAADSGDKATPKAMTSALKAFLRQSFAIADSEHDPDATTPEETVAPPEPAQRVPASDVEKVTDLRERLAVIAARDVEAATRLREAWTTVDVPGQNGPGLGSVSERAWADGANPAARITDAELTVAERLVGAAELALVEATTASAEASS